MKKAHHNFSDCIKIGSDADAVRYEYYVDGSPVSLTGATVTFRMWKQTDGTVLVSDAAATVEDAANAIVRYDLQAADVDEAGTMICEFTITLSGGAIHRTLDLLLEILPRG